MSKTRWIVGPLLALALSAAPARADTPLGGRGKVGQTVTGFGVSLSATGEVRVWRGRARRPLTVKLGVTPAKGARFDTRLVRVKQSGRAHDVLWVSAKSPRGEGALEAAVWLQRRRLVLIWAGTTGLQGEDKAWSQHLSVTPQGVMVYQRTPALQRCDGLAARMLSRGYHFASRRLLPVLLQPLSRAGAVELTATTTPPAAVRDRPVAPFRFTAASSELGCAGQARRVSPPSELHDERPSTAWIEGQGGPGRWEYATAHASGHSVGVRAIRIQPGHATHTAQYNRLKTVWLLLGPKHRYRVTFPQDPLQTRAAAKTPAAWAYWVVLPRPVRSRCLTVVIEDVYPAASGQTAISEVSAFSELDFGNPVARILRGVTSGSVEKVVAVLYLTRIGRGNLATLRQALPKAASAAEQEVVLFALARLDAAGSAKLLAQHVPGVTPAARRELLDALVRVGDPAVKPLAALLTDQTSAAALGPVALAVARIGTAGAARALVARIGTGRVPLRRAVVTALARMPLRHVRGEIMALLQRPSLSGVAQADLARLLASLVARHPSLRLDAASLVLSAWPRVHAFEARYRFLDLMGQLGDPRFFDTLARLAGSQADPILRERAVLALARSRSAARASAIERALQDAHPRVRRGAVQAWARTRQGSAVRTIGTLAVKDPWPLVREAAVRSLARVCLKDGLPTLMILARTRVHRSLRHLRRLALLGALRCRAPGALALLGQILESDQERVVMRRFAVRLLGERKDRRHLTYLIEFLDLLAKKVRRARSRNEALAADLATALASIGDRRAVPVLIRAAGTVYLVQLRAAALRALRRFCDPRAKAAVLRALKSPHRLVLVEAQETQRQCHY